MSILRLCKKPPSPPLSSPPQKDFLFSSENQTTRTLPPFPQKQRQQYNEPHSTQSYSQVTSVQNPRNSPYGINIATKIVPHPLQPRHRLRHPHLLPLRLPRRPINTREKPHAVGFLFQEQRIYQEYGGARVCAEWVWVVASMRMNGGNWDGRGKW